jgi:hypothetical protein
MVRIFLPCERQSWLLFFGAAAVPALAQVYPVQGRSGESASSEKGAIDCTSKRVIEFTGNQRTDSNGGVPAYRNQSVVPEGPSTFRVVDEFSTGQISNGHTSYTLRQVDPDHIELVMEAGAMKFQRCK